MPIRPDLRQFYGREWRGKRAAILKRAHNRCEQCAAPDRTAVERGPNGMWRLLSSPPGTPWRNNRGNITTFEPTTDVRRDVRIVLTVAHLNHESGDDRDENLKARIRYAEGGPSIEVSLVYTWDRDKMPPLVTGSSGPKEYIRNDVHTLFDANPEVDRVVMVTGNNVPFFLMRGPHNCWFDVTGKQVVNV